MQTHAKGAGAVGRWFTLIGMTSSMFLFQQGGCSLDPDIFLATFLQIVGDVGLFTLQNAIYAL